jgi:hypothetical protein
LNRGIKQIQNASLIKFQYKSPKLKALQFFHLPLTSSTNYSRVFFAGNPAMLLINFFCIYSFPAKFLHDEFIAFFFWFLFDVELGIAGFCGGFECLQEFVWFL